MLSTRRYPSRITGIWSPIGREKSRDEAVAAPSARLSGEVARSANRSGSLPEVGERGSQATCKPHLMTPPGFAGVRVLGVDEHVWHHQDRRRRGPREHTGIVDLTRGKDHPTARLSGPGPRQVWHRTQELAGRARRRLPCGGANRDAGSLPGIQERHRRSTPRRNQRPRCLPYRQARWRRSR